MLAMWSSGCQCLLNIVVILEPLRYLFQKAVPPLFQTLLLSTHPFLYLCDIMFVYSASYGPKTVLMTRARVTSRQIRAAAWLLPDDFSVIKSGRDALHVESLNKQISWLTAPLISLNSNMFHFFPHLFQNICFQNTDLWDLNSAEKINTHTVNFIFDGKDMEMLLIEVMTSMCG